MRANRGHKAGGCAGSGKSGDYADDAAARPAIDPPLDRLVVAFVSAYDFAKHLKALRWRTPFEVVGHTWTTTLDVFKLSPRQLIPCACAILSPSVVARKASGREQQE